MAGQGIDERGVIIECGNCGQRNRVMYERLDHPLRCGKCRQPIPAVSAPVEVPSTALFDTLVAHASIPVIVDYWAPWCGPCRIVAPELAKVAARQAGRYLIVKVNTDVLDDLGARAGIQSIPTMAVFSGGQEVARTSGARPAADIEAFVQQASTRS